MRRTIAFSAILFAIAISGNLHSAGPGGIITPEDFYCGYDDEMKECTWVLKGSVCIADENCKPVVVTPPGGKE